jgi:phospholipid/cholesterol/gamma-HCH transport system ATP-binding protein
LNTPEQNDPRRSGSEPGGSDEWTEQTAEQAEPAADERAADDRYAFEDAAADRGEAPEPARARTETEAPAPGNGPYRSEDGATLGRDFSIPGVDPEDDNPYRWHTGEKRDHGGEDAIEIIDLVKQFGRTRILNGLNLGLPDDQISMVLGPSGTGKSVLIKHIVGLLYPDSGDVLVHGESVPNMTDDELFEAHYKMPNELSGGMRKRAGFARALVLDPAIVMFDEPDSGLDPVRTALLCELIREVHEENGGCYMVISHDLGTARRIADFIAVLWKGKIVESGPKEELFNSDNEFVSQFLNADVEGPLAMD